MVREKRNIFLFLKGFLLIVVILVLAKSLLKTSLFSFLDNQGSQQTSSLNQDRLNFANCLNKEGVVMYGDDACQYCQIQKKMFGSAFSQIKYINCQFDQDICQSKGITAYPVWEKGQEIKKGVLDFEKLSQWTGCQQPNK